MTLLVDSSWITARTISVLPFESLPIPTDSHAIVDDQILCVRWGAITGQLTMGLARGRRYAAAGASSRDAPDELSLHSRVTGPSAWHSSLGGHRRHVYGIMMLAFRFLLIGVGVGGKYPLAATISKEDSARFGTMVVQDKVNTRPHCVDKVNSTFTCVEQSRAVIVVD